MDFMIDVFIEFFQPIGNVFVNKILPRGMVEEDSIISVFIGGLIVIISLMVLGVLLVKLFGT